MAVMKKVSIKNASGTGYDSRDIGAEAQNIDVSYDANGNIIEDISSATVSSTKSLAKALKNIKIDDLINTTISSPANGQGLIYDGSKWTNKDIETGSSVDELNDLTDVNISSSPTNGQGLIYNGSKWVNKNIETGSAISTLNDLTDVTVSSSPSSGQGLIYNGSKWVNGSLNKTLSDLTDTSISGTPSNGQVLTYSSGRWVNAANSASDKMDKDGSNAASSVNMSSTTSFRIGPNCIANGNYSQAIGYEAKAYNECSYAEGYQTCAGGPNSVGQEHAEGYQTCAVISASHAEGSRTCSAGAASHAEGLNTYTKGSASHAEGAYTSAIEYASHAEGYNTCASGTGSHAEGYNTCALGNYSHTGGSDTCTAVKYEFVHGANINGNTGADKYFGGHLYQNFSTVRPVTYYASDNTLSFSSTEKSIFTVGNGSSAYLSSNGELQGYVNIGSNGNIYSTGMRFKSRGIINGVLVGSSSHKIYLPKGSVHWLIANSYLNTTGAYRGTNSYLITVNGGGSSSSQLALPKAQAFGASTSSGVSLSLGAEINTNYTDKYTNGSYCGYVTIGSCTAQCKVAYAIIPILTPFGDFATTFS